MALIRVQTARGCISSPPRAHRIDDLKWTGPVSVLVPGHPDRSGQLRDEPVLRLSALAHRGRPGRRIRTGLWPQDGPQRVVKRLTSTFSQHFQPDFDFDLIFPAVFYSKPSRVLHSSPPFNLYLFYLKMQKISLWACLCFNGSRCLQLLLLHFNFSPFGVK